MSSSTVLRNVIQAKTTLGLGQPGAIIEGEAESLNSPDAHSQILVENAPVALAMFDEKMRYLVANRMWVEEFGLQQVIPLVGRSQYEVFPSLHQGWKQVYERALQGHVVRSEHDGQGNKNDEPITYRWEVRPWRKQADNAVGGIIVSCEKFPSAALIGKTETTPQPTSDGLDGAVFNARIPMLLLDASGRVQRANVSALNPVLSKGIQEGLSLFWSSYGEGADPILLKEQTLAALERLAKSESPTTELLTIQARQPSGDTKTSPNDLPTHWVITRAGGRNSGQFLAVASYCESPDPASGGQPTDTRKWEEELNRARQEVAVLRDVEVAFAKREARQKMVLDSLACGLVVLNERGLPIHHNDHIAKLLGRGLQAGESVENWLLSACPTEEHQKTVSTIWSNDIWRRQLTRVMSLATADGLLKELEFRPVSLSGGGLLITIHDVTDTCRMEEQLRSTEAKFRTLINEAPVGVVLIDKSGSIFEANSAAERMMQRSKAELRRLNSENWLSPESVAKRRDTLRQMRDEGRRTAAIEVAIQQPDGTAQPAHLRIALVPDASGEIHTAFHFLQAIETPSAPPASAEVQPVRVETPPPAELPAPESSVSILWLLQTDGSGRIAQWTDEATARFGFTAAEAQGQWLHGLYRPSDPTGFYADIQERVASPDEAFEWTYFGKGGVRGSGRFFAKAGAEGGNSIDLFEERITVSAGVPSQVEGATVISTGVTSGKTIAPWPAADLDREKLLLSETHHRIKNHLQIISSMLNLQMNSLSDQPARDILRSSQNRVRSIAALHQYLYQLVLEDGSDFGDFARGLAERLRECYAVTEEQVALTLEISPGLLDHEWMMPLALILNETLSNAFEHAFPEGRQGAIDVRLSFQDGQGQFFVRDNGIGLPEGFDPSAASGLGLKILGVFAEQMKGELKLTGNPEAGTEFNLRFPMAHVDN